MSPTATPVKESRGTMPIRLSNGRVVLVELPLPMAAEELLELIAVLPGAVAQMNLQALGDVAGHVSLPGGRTLAVVADRQQA